MATFVLIHGGGDVGWYRHRVVAELQDRGHEAVAPDLPCETTRPASREYADCVVDAIGDATAWSSLASPTAASRHRWWPTGAGRPARLGGGNGPGSGGEPSGVVGQHRYRQAVQEQARRDGGKTGSDDPFVAFYHDVPRARRGGMSRERSESDAADHAPWPLVPGWPFQPGSCCAARIVSSRPTSCAASSPNDSHRARRDHRWPLCRAQPPEGADRDARRLHGRPLPINNSDSATTRPAACRSPGSVMRFRSRRSGRRRVDHRRSAPPPSRPA